MSKGNRELRQILIAVRRLCGQAATWPSGVSAQLRSRIKAPISPPPARISAGFATRFACAPLLIGQPLFFQYDLHPRALGGCRGLFVEISADAHDAETDLPGEHPQTGRRVELPLEGIRRARP